MSDQKWKASGRAGNPVLILTEANLAALAVGSSKLSATVSQDTSGDLDLLVDLELNVTFAAAPTDGGAIDLYLVRSVRTGVFESAVEGNAAATRLPKSSGYVGSFIVNIETTQSLILGFVEAPPRDHKWLLVNNTSQAFHATTDCELRGYYYRTQSV